jgi:subtilisin family serine protease
MRTRARSAAAALLLLAGAALVTGAQAEDRRPDSGAAGWQGLLGTRPEPQLGGRWIVVLRNRSLADRVRAAGGVASEAQMKRWTAAARDAQTRVLQRLAFRGAPVQPEHEYLRVVNGFAAALDPGAIAVIERDPDVAGVYPVRAAYPAQAEPVTTVVGRGEWRRPGVGVPGFDGSGVTVALLDTGVDFDHPYLEDALLPGIDVVDPGGLAQPGTNPTEPGRVERHGTEMAGLVAGSGGPAGLAGVAPGATIRPIRVAGWQPDGSGGVSVYARTDQVLAGLEHAVDPNRDGDVHDAARIALVGVVEPFESFPDAPLGRAATGALALDTLVVAAAGNDGPAGPAFGSIGAPASSPGALAVAAADTRRRSPIAHVLLRTGLRVLMSGEQSLGGTIASETTVDAPVVALRGRGTARVGAQAGFRRLFDGDGFSLVAGTAPLLPPGPPAPETVQELAAAGARAVLVDGPLPAGALGVAEPLLVPVLGLSSDVAREVRTHLAAGRLVELAVGASAFETNPAVSALASFSSEGLSVAGAAKPELSAAGVGIATSVPGRLEDGSGRFGSASGTSVAAAVVAGAAALVVQARPDLDASALRGALVSSARPVPGASDTATGAVDPGAAISTELVVEPATLSLGAPLEEGVVVRQIRLRNVTDRPLRLVLPDSSAGSAAVQLSTATDEVTVGARRSRVVGVTASIQVLPRAPSGVSGILRARVEGGSGVRIPWALAVPVSDRPLLAGVRLSRAEFAPSDVEPAVLTFAAGRVDGSRDQPQLLPLRSLVIELHRGGRRRGNLVRLRNVLPGRFAFAITGRGPKGVKLPPGEYRLRLVATPAGGGPRDVETVPFVIS